MIKKFLTLIIFFFFFCINLLAIDDISINNQDMFPRFDKKVKVYNVFVEDNIEIITINAINSENETITGIGSKSLKKGLNTFEINSYFNEKLIEKYYINITRGQEEYDETDSRLESLNIENVSFNFKSDIYNYEIEVGDDLETVGISYEAKNPLSYVKVLGSNYLNSKDNIIKIKIISEDKKNSSIYTINLKKNINLDLESSKISVFDNKKFSSFELKIIRISLIFLGILIISVIFYFLFIKKRTN